MGEWRVIVWKTFVAAVVKIPVAVQMRIRRVWLKLELGMRRGYTKIAVTACKVVLSSE